jgi:hypothetical protein
MMGRKEEAIFFEAMQEMYLEKQFQGGFNNWSV